MDGKLEHLITGLLDPALQIVCRTAQVNELTDGIKIEQGKPGWHFDAAQILDWFSTYSAKVRHYLRREGTVELALIDSADEWADISVQHIGTAHPDVFIPYLDMVKSALHNQLTPQSTEPFLNDNRDVIVYLASFLTSDLQLSLTAVGMAFRGKAYVNLPLVEQGFYAALKTNMEAGSAGDALRSRAAQFAIGMLKHVIAHESSHLYTPELGERHRELARQNRAFEVQVYRQFVDFGEERIKAIAAKTISHTLPTGLCTEHYALGLYARFFEIVNTAIEQRTSSRQPLAIRDFKGFPDRIAIPALHLQSSILSARISDVVNESLADFLADMALSGDADHTVFKDAIASVQQNRDASYHEFSHARRAARPLIEHLYRRMGTGVMQSLLQNPPITLDELRAPQTYLSRIKYESRR